MKDELLKYIRCPICHGRDFVITRADYDLAECREGEVQCVACARAYPVRKGILDLLPAPSPVILSEQKGWAEMLGETTEELVETMLALPYLADDLWSTVHTNFDQAMQLVDLSGKSVLDIGAGRGWSSRWMARAGAGNIVATDILTQRFIGLETADIYLERDSVYFERVVADMNDLPLGEQVFDVVFIASTLHHSSHIRKTMKEVARVLVSGGTAIIISEPVRSLFWPHDLSNNPEIAHGINEHVYSIMDYLWAVGSVGLVPRLAFPASIAHKLDLHDAAAVRELGKIAPCFSKMWRVPAGRRLMRTLLRLPVYVTANIPLVMTCTKV
jgi:SAM-dependent methyltransferase/uncharacterized protein YbaR (Trm112 family)